MHFQKGKVTFMSRVYNFSAGPSMLPLPVLEKAASELISYGTSYTNTQTTQTYAEVPYDRDELGKKIYESASTLCEDGYVFCFVTEEGYSHRVVIPFSVEEMFVLDK